MMNGNKYSAMGLIATIVVGGVVTIEGTKLRSSGLVRHLNAGRRDFIPHNMHSVYGKDEEAGGMDRNSEVNDEEDDEPFYSINPCTGAISNSRDKYAGMTKDDCPDVNGNVGGLGDNPGTAADENEGFPLLSSGIVCPTIHSDPSSSGIQQESTFEFYFAVNTNAADGNEPCLESGYLVENMYDTLSFRMSHCYENNQGRRGRQLLLNSSSDHSTVLHKARQLGLIGLTPISQEVTELSCPPFLEADSTCSVVKASMGVSHLDGDHIDSTVYAVRKLVYEMMTDDFLVQSTACPSLSEVTYLGVTREEVRDFQKSRCPFIIPSSTGIETSRSFEFDYYYAVQSSVREDPSLYGEGRLGAQLFYLVQDLLSDCKTINLNHLAPDSSTGLACPQHLIQRGEYCTVMKGTIIFPGEEGDMVSSAIQKMQEVIESVIESDRLTSSGKFETVNKVTYVGETNEDVIGLDLVDDYGGPQCPVVHATAQSTNAQESTSFSYWYSLEHSDEEELSLVNGSFDLSLFNLIRHIFFAGCTVELSTGGATLTSYQCPAALTDPSHSCSVVIGTMTITANQGDNIAQAIDVVHDWIEFVMKGDRVKEIGTVVTMTYLGGSMPAGLVLKPGVSGSGGDGSSGENGEGGNRGEDDGSAGGGGVVIIVDGNGNTGDGNGGDSDGSGSMGGADGSGTGGEDDGSSGGVVIIVDGNGNTGDGNGGDSGGSGSMGGEDDGSSGGVVVIVDGNGNTGDGNGGDSDGSGSMGGADGSGTGGEDNGSSGGVVVIVDGNGNTSDGNGGDSDGSGSMGGAGGSGTGSDGSNNDAGDGGANGGDENADGSNGAGGSTVDGNGNSTGDGNGSEDGSNSDGTNGGNEDNSGGDGSDSGGTTGDENENSSGGSNGSDGGSGEDGSGSGTEGTTGDGSGGSNGSEDIGNGNDGNDGNDGGNGGSQGGGDGTDSDGNTVDGNGSTTGGDNGDSGNDGDSSIGNGSDGDNGNDGDGESNSEEGGNSGAGGGTTVGDGDSGQGGDETSTDAGSDNADGSTSASGNEGEDSANGGDDSGADSGEEGLDGVVGGQGSVSDGDVGGDRGEGVDEETGGAGRDRVFDDFSSVQYGETDNEDDNAGLVPIIVLAGTGMLLILLLLLWRRRQNYVVTTRHESLTIEQMGRDIEAGDMDDSALAEMDSLSFSRGATRKRMKPHEKINSNGLIVMVGGDPEGSFHHGAYHYTPSGDRYLSSSCKRCIETSKTLNSKRNLPSIDEESVFTEDQFGNAGRGFGSSTDESSTASPDALDLVEANSKDLGLKLTTHNVHRCASATCPNCMDNANVCKFIPSTPRDGEQSSLETVSAVSSMGSQTARHSNRSAEDLIQVDVSGDGSI